MCIGPEEFIERMEGMIKSGKIKPSRQEKIKGIWKIDLRPCFGR